MVKHTKTSGIPDYRYYHGREGDKTLWVRLTDHPLPGRVSHFHKLPEHVRFEIIQKYNELNAQTKHEKSYASLSDTYKLYEYEKQDNFAKAYHMIMKKHYPDLYNK